MYAGNAYGLPACLTFVVAGLWFKRAAFTVKLAALLPQQPENAAANLWVRYKNCQESPHGDFWFYIGCLYFNLFFYFSVEARVPEIYDIGQLDEKIRIRDEDAFEMARSLAMQEGIFAGISAGAAMYVAVRKAKQLDSGLIVVIIPDRGDRYLTTDLFCFNPCGNTNCSIKAE